jgi:hypothetical protein
MSVDTSAGTSMLIHVSVGVLLVDLRRLDVELLGRRGRRPGWGSLFCVLPYAARPM